MPKPNLTATVQQDGSVIYADDLNNKFIYPAQLLYPTADLSDAVLLNGLRNTFQDYNSRFGGNLTRLLAE